MRGYAPPESTAGPSKQDLLDVAGIAGADPEALRRAATAHSEGKISQQDFEHRLSELVHQRSKSLQKGPPGPPPRPNLVWKQETHRWINPENGKMHDHTGKEFSPGFHAGHQAASSILGEMAHDDREMRRDGNVMPSMAEQISHELEVSHQNQTTASTPSARNRELGKRDALRHRHNELTGQPLHTGRIGYDKPKASWDARP